MIMEHRHEHPTIEHLRQLPLFDKISNENLSNIAKGAHLEIFKKKEMIFFQGDMADKCYIILHGAVKIYLETVKSHESILGIAAEKEVLGDIAIHEGARFMTSAQVVQDTKVLAIPACQLRYHIKADGQFATNLLKSVSCSMQKLVRQIEHQTLMTAPERVGCFLLKLSRRCKEGVCKAVTFPYEKRLIAAQLQMSPETFSRALETLKDHGVFVDHANVIVTDRSALREFACQNCSHIPLPGEDFDCCGDTCSL